jgi:hypothetical protein
MNIETLREQLESTVASALEFRTQIQREYVPEKHASMIYGIALDTLKAMREGKSKIAGPPFINFGNRVLYCRKDFDEWINQFRVVVEPMQTAELVDSETLEEMTT